MALRLPVSPEVAVTLLILCTCALAAPLVAAHLHVPAAVVEIALGAAAAAVLGSIERGGLVALLAQIGFALLMFLAGAEVDLHRALAAGRPRLLPSFAAVLAIFAVAGLETYLLGLDPFFWVLAGAVSIGVATSVLRELDKLAAPVGQAALLIGGPGTLAAILILATLTAWSTRGLSWLAAGELLAVALLFGFAVLALLALRALVWCFPAPFGRLVRSHDTGEIGVRASLAFLFVFVALARWLGLGVVLGAFVAGLAFGFVFRQRAPLTEKLSAAGFGFLIPVFFVNVGLETRLPSALQSENVAVLGTIVGLALAARLTIVPILRLSGMPWRDAIGAALLLSAPLSMTVAVATTGRELGHFDEPTTAAVLLYAALSAFVYPILARRVVGDDGTAAGPVAAA
jgi:Kef-type K+ transport system membrane component KefB